MVGRQRAWLVVALLPPGVMLYSAVKAIWTIAAQWSDWFLVIGTMNALLGLVNLLVASLALAASMVGLWRYRSWGWSLAFVVYSVGLAGAVFVRVVSPRQDLTLLTLLSAAGLAVLLFSPLREEFAGSRLLAWWEGAPTPARTIGVSLGIVQTAVAALCLMVLMFGSVYGGFNLAAILFVIAGIAAGVLLFVAGGLPAYGVVIAWCASFLVYVARFLAADPRRHRADGTTRAVAAYCIVAGMYLTLAVGHEIVWRARQRARPASADRLPS